MLDGLHNADNDPFPLPPEGYARQNTYQLPNRTGLSVSMVELMDKHVDDYIDTPSENRKEWLKAFWHEVWWLKEPGWDFQAEEPTVEENAEYHEIKQVRCLMLFAFQFC